MNVISSAHGGQEAARGALGRPLTAFTFFSSGWDGFHPGTCVQDGAIEHFIVLERLGRITENGAGTLL